MKIFKILLMSLGAIFMVLIMVSLRPVNIVPEDKCIVVSGVVTHIFEAGVKDVNFRLKDNNTTYYINRGLEQGLDLETLRNDLIGNTITIKYPPHWTPLDLGNRVKHISFVRRNGELIYSELD